MRNNDDYANHVANQYRNAIKHMIQFENSQTQGTKLQFNVFTTQPTRTPFIMRLAREAEKFDGKAEVFAWHHNGLCLDQINKDLPYIYETPFDFSICPNEFLGLPGYSIEGDGDPLSACAEAINELVYIYNEKFGNLHTTIIGRGEAVRGLGDHLRDGDYTVSQCHSHTLECTMTSLIECSDLTIWAVRDPAQNIPLVKVPPRAVFIDICGGRNISEFRALNPDLIYYSPSQIGEITALAIFRRAAQNGGFVNGQ